MVPLRGCLGAGLRVQLPRQQRLLAAKKTLKSACVETVYVDDRCGTGGEFNKTGAQGEVFHVDDGASSVNVLECATRSLGSLERRGTACRDYGSTAARPVNRCRGEGNVVGHVRSLPETGTYVMGKMSLGVIFLVLEQEPRY
jgi:hypothetical protein